MMHAISGILCLVVVALFQGTEGYGWIPPPNYDCMRTSCTSFPDCPAGYTSLDDDNTCGSVKSRKYCCRNNQGPQCFTTSCKSFPDCPSGYISLDEDTTSCGGTKSSKYCCKTGQGPQCFPTACANFPSCPYEYDKLDEDNVSCGGTKSKNICCRPGSGPQCFVTSCNNFISSCPSGFKQQQKLSGGNADCPKSGMSRSVCCKG